MPTRTVVTIGNFDGVHVGHAALVARARSLADRTGGVGGAGGAGRVVAMAFDPHPMSFLRPDAAPARLSTFQQRSEHLRALGADEVVRLDPTPELLSLSPEEFLRRLVDEHAPAAIVEGPDFCFGRARAGDVRTLAALGQRFGFEVEVATPVDATLSDQTIVTASSTITRWLVGKGRMRDAAIVLGRAYEIIGEVVQGDQRGRTIGCPTANISTPQLLPRDGVYAGVARLPDGRALPAAISVGDKPTFGRSNRTLEAHLLDWPGPVAEGAPEYGWTLRLEIVSWLRDQIRYDSIDALMSQIARDIERTRRIAEEARIAPMRRETKQESVA